MPVPVMGAGFGLLACLALAAFRLPAPRVSDDVWACARVAVLPVSLVWMVSLTVCARPTAFAFAMVSGVGCCVVAWVMRAPPEPPLRDRQAGEDPGDDGGGGDDGGEPGDGPGGGRIDWDAFERAAYDAWRARTPVPQRSRMPD
jgi:hypothetical protein